MNAGSVDRTPAPVPDALMAREIRGQLVTRRFRFQQDYWTPWGGLAMTADRQIWMFAEGDTEWHLSTLLSMDAAIDDVLDGEPAQALEDII